MDPNEVDALRAAVSRLARRLRNEGSGSDTLSATGVAVLARLRRDGAQTLQALAAAEHVRPPSMTRIVDRLVEMGLVTRAPHPDDGRAVLVRLGEPGASFLADTVRQRSAWLTERLGALDAADADALRAALPALQRLADAS
ncbi:MarR family transcriptional regulator [Propioniciclava soli]|uniref:MarR family transcriptional regulator n=1 Tax=Propioniciclava soli TaxID=2775081 RepID=UPI001E5ECFA7